MNKWIAMGRLTKDPEIRYGGTNNTCIARFNLAVDRRFKRDGQPEADFFSCTAFGKTGEFVEKYLKKGIKVVVEGEPQNDNYEKDGVKHYGFQFIVNSLEFAESKKASEQNNVTEQNNKTTDDGFMDVPDSIEETLPFN